MKKYTLLWSAIILLFVLNIATIAFLIVPKPGNNHDQHRRKDFDRLVVETLHLRAEQIEQFEVFKSAHHTKMMELDQAMKAPFEAYFELLTQQGNVDAERQILEQKMDSIYQKKLQFTYEHFNDLKSICTPEQQKGFSTLIPRFMEVMLPAPPPGRE